MYLVTALKCLFPKSVNLRKSYKAVTFSIQEMAVRSCYNALQFCLSLDPSNHLEHLCISTTEHKYKEPKGDRGFLTEQLTQSQSISQIILITDLLINMSNLEGPTVED